jgi:hypothetical protein
MGRIKISIPTPDAPMDVWVDIVQAEVPLLLGLDTMSRNGLNVLIATDELFSAIHGWTLPLRRAKGHLLLEWATPSSACWYSRAQLLKMHRHLLHPSTTQLMNILRRANPKDLPPETRSLLEDISRACHACQVYASKPISFQVRDVDDIVFNQEIRLDLMYIDGRPVLHVVDTGTTFGAATFLDEQSFGSVWNALLRCWSTMYVGFPMSMLTDQGSVFLSRDWKASCAALGIRLRHTGTESHNSLGTGERFHAPLRRIYNKVSLDHPLVPPDVRLAMSVHAMNTTQGPEGLVPITLVFGKTPVIPHVDQVPVAQAPRLRAMHTAKAEYEQLLAERRI